MCYLFQTSWQVSVLFKCWSNTPDASHLGPTVCVIFYFSVYFVPDKIARAADLFDWWEYEIGAGPGGLTRSVLNAGARRVAAVEIDKRFIPSLQVGKYNDMCYNLPPRSYDCYFLGGGGGGVVNINKLKKF